MVLKLHDLAIKVNEWMSEYENTSKLKVHHWYSKDLDEHYLTLENDEMGLDYINWKQGPSVDDLRRQK